MPDMQLDALYAMSMWKHAHGHALYEPVSSKLLRPGMCGYLAANGGGWTPLFDLTASPEELEQKHGLSKLTGLEFAPEEEFEWGPKISEKVEQRKFKVEGEVDGALTGLPANVGGLFSYATDTDFGGVLLAKSPVKKQRIYHEALFGKWARQNALKILAKWEDVKKRGFFIVTWTYTTEEAKITTWDRPGIGISVGVKVGATPVGEIAPAVEWYTQGADSGWIRFQPKTPGESKVVFFGGLYFRFRPFKIENHAVSEINQRKWAKYRGREDEEDPEDIYFEVQLGDEAFEVDCVPMSGRTDEDGVGQTDN